jgi:hypothetical protein
MRITLAIKCPVEKHNVSRDEIGPTSLETGVSPVMSQPPMNLVEEEVGIARGAGSRASGFACSEPASD